MEWRAAGVCRKSNFANDVEVGAGTSIDRCDLRDIVIGQLAKIDNQVQIGHNVRGGINDYLRIGHGAQVGAMSAVEDDSRVSGRWGGHFARPTSQWFGEIAAVERSVHGAVADPKGEGRE